MRKLVSVIIFLFSFTLLTIGCTWAWETSIKDRLYNCSDDVPLNYLQPGQWVHKPVAVKEVTIARSMNQRDTIKQGWSVSGLWMLWFSWIGGITTG